MRALGGLEMSVGTSLAFEGEFSSGIAGVDSLLLNLNTLIRNAREAFQEVDLKFITPGDLKKYTKDTLDAVKDDIGRIAKFVQDKQGQRVINIVIYSPTYKSLKSKYSRAKLWEPRTTIQLNKAKIDKEVTEALLKEYKDFIVVTDINLPEFAGKGAIITHHPVDLVQTKSTLRLYLIESYTGAIKPYTKWYTKLTGSETLSNMPLNKLTIQVFGDNGVNFFSDRQAIKNLVREVAEKGQWSSGISLDRVRSTINNYTTGIDKAGLLLLLD